MVKGKMCPISYQRSLGFPVGHYHMQFTGINIILHKTTTKPLWLPLPFKFRYVFISSDIFFATPPAISFEQNKMSSDVS